MSYRQNPIKMDKNGNVDGTQINMFSEYYNLSPRYRRDLQKGWAGAFRVLIMPNIDESPYSALYSELPGRPNTAAPSASTMWKSKIRKTSFWAPAPSLIS